MEGELPGDTVSAEQVERYCLNAGGWYALRGVLSPAEAASLRAAIADDPSAAAGRRCSGRAGVGAGSRGERWPSSAARRPDAALAGVAIAERSPPLSRYPSPHAAAPILSADRHASRF